MQSKLLGCAVVAVGLLVLNGLIVLQENPLMAQGIPPSTDPKAAHTGMLAHDVFFALHESTPANRQKLVDACKKYLTGHPGVVFFAVGTVAELKRDVNVRDWDVGLHVVFKTHADHDAYQTDPRHLKFIEENKATWKKVRVYDTDFDITAVEFGGK